MQQHDESGGAVDEFAVLAVEQAAGGGVLTSHGVTLDTARTAAAARAASSTLISSATPSLRPTTTEALSGR